MEKEFNYQEEFHGRDPSNPMDNPKESSLSDEICKAWCEGETNMLHVEDVKEFIKIVENIIVERKPRSVQLLELKKATGNNLL